MNTSLHYLDLLLYKTYADLKVESARTYIGFLWWFIDPVINMAVFYLVFSVILRRGTEDYVPFLLIGIVIWKWFNSSVVAGAKSIQASAALILQVRVPKIIFPLSTMLHNAAHFAIALIILLIFLWVYGFAFSMVHLALLPLLITQIIFMLSCALILSSLTPFFPDLNILLENVLRVMFFVSGIFFPTAQLPESVRSYFLLNPMVILIEGFRGVLMYQEAPPVIPLIILNILSIAGVLIGYALLKKYDHDYPRIVLL